MYFVVKRKVKIHSLFLDRLLLALLYFEDEIGV